MNSTASRTRVQPEARDAKLAAYYAARRPTSNAYVDGGWIRKLGPHAAAVYMTVDRYVQSTGLSSVTVAQVVDRTGMDPATVCRAFDAMILHGLLWIESEGKAGRATRYSPYAPGVLAGWNPTSAARLHGLPPEREAKARARQDARQALQRTRASRLGREPRAVSKPKKPPAVKSPPAPAGADVPATQEVVVEAAAEAVGAGSWAPSDHLEALLSWARETWPKARFFPLEAGDPEAPIRTIKISVDGRELDPRVDLRREPREVAEQIRRAVEDGVVAYAQSDEEAAARVAAAAGELERVRRMVASCNAQRVEEPAPSPPPTPTPTEPTYGATAAEEVARVDPSASSPLRPRGPSRFSTRPVKQADEGPPGLAGVLRIARLANPGVRLSYAVDPVSGSPSVVVESKRNSALSAWLPIPPDADGVPDLDLLADVLPGEVDRLEARLLVGAAVGDDDEE